MYLKQLYVENNGPLKHVHLELPFTTEGVPKPVVLVGRNGSGKTNLLSIIGDGIISAAASYYTNALPGMSETHKPWFRMLGARTIRAGTSGSFTVMQFEHESATYLFKEKGGRVSPDGARARLPESLQPAVTWGEDENIKHFGIAQEQAGQIFQKGAYVYFPSSRAEAPHWLNAETVATAEFELQPQITKRRPSRSTSRKRWSDFNNGYCPSSLSPVATLLLIRRMAKPCDAGFSETSSSISQLSGY